MKRPMLIITIGYIIGIIWGLYLKISIVPFYIGLIVIYIIIHLSYRKKKFKIFSIKRYFRYLKIMFKINFILLIISSSFISNLIIIYQENKYEKSFVEGQNLEIVAVVISNVKEQEYSNKYEVKTISNEKLYIYVDKKVKLEYGDKIKIKGEFQEPQSSRNYKGFDYKQYLKTKKIYGSIKVADVKILDKNKANKIMQLSNSIFLKIQDNIKNTYDEKIYPIISGIMLGYTEEIDENTKQNFSTSNISHVLAVSGMHISYIIILITSSTQKLLGKRNSKIIASIVLIIYMFITGFSVSIIRAGIMGIILCMAFVLYRKSDTLNNISIAIVLTLINNPYSINSISFLLTYGGTIGILYFEKIIENIIKNIKIKNRKYKYAFIKIQRKCSKLIEVVSVTISAQIIIMPIMILSFNTIGLGFLLTNLLLSSIIGIIVMGGFVQIMISFISINAGKALANIIKIPLYLLLQISKINIGNYNVVTPDFYQIILYYLLIFILRKIYLIFHSNNCTTTQNRIKNTMYLIRFKIKPYIKSLKFSIILVLFIICFINIIPHDLEIYFIDVGQGDCTLIITPNNKKILIDGGGSENYDVGENILIPYLLDRKISSLDYVIISHFDQDHIGGILSVLKEIKVQKIIIGKQGAKNEQYEELYKIVKEKNILLSIVEKGDIINIEKNVQFKILFPEKELIKENVLNNNSIVAKLEYKNFKILFTGDIEEIAEKKLIKYYSKEELNADILKISHHGSKTSTTTEFLDVVNPRIALIGVGQNNKFGHPDDSIINNLANRNIKIFRTDKMGEIIIKSDGNKIKKVMGYIPP